MNVFIVHAHPEPQSFCSALTRTAWETLEASGHKVEISDLYQMEFDPVSGRHNFQEIKDASYFKQQIEEKHASQNDSFAPEIKSELEKLFWCDCLLMHFPLWWFSMPAIMKGWVDRVLVMGKVYGGGKWYDNGAFRGKKGMLCLTTGGPAGIYAADGLNGDINQILFPINHGILRFTGFDVLPPFIAWGPAHVGHDMRKKYLDDFRRTLLALENLKPISYPGLSEYDPGTFRLKK